MIGKYSCTMSDICTCMEKYNCWGEKLLRNVSASFAPMKQTAICCNYLKSKGVSLNVVNICDVFLTLWNRTVCLRLYLGPHSWHYDPTMLEELDITINHASVSFPQYLVTAQRQVPRGKVQEPAPQHQRLRTRILLASLPWSTNCKLDILLLLIKTIILDFRGGFMKATFACSSIIGVKKYFFSTVKVL